MSDSDINTLKLTVLEERTVMALYDLGSKGLPVNQYLAECLDRLCQGTPAFKPLPGGCYFQRSFSLDRAMYEPSVQHQLSAETLEQLGGSKTVTSRMDTACEQHKIQLATRLDDIDSISINGENARALYILPLTIGEETFGVILLFLQQVYQPSKREITLLKRCSRVIAQGLKQSRELDKWVHAYQDLQLNHIHQFNQISQICSEISLPASAISGVSDQIASKNLAAIKDQSQLLKGSANHLKTLIKKLNRYIVYDSRNIDLENRLFSFNDSITSYLREVRSLVEARGLNFSLHVDRNIPSKLIGDFDKIRQVISILIDNATKFTQDGEIAVSIELAKQHQDRLEIIFAVQDTGMGIKPSDQKQMFENGAQLHTEQAADMPVIRHGLRLARRYIEIMGGQLDLDSRPGVGSKFSFQIPMKAPSDSTSGNNVESTLTMEAITVLPHDMIRETERITRENHELLSSLLNVLNKKLCDYDITSDQAINDIIPVMKNTVYRKDLKAIKTAINQYDFETSVSLLQGLANALKVSLSNDPL